MTEEEIIKQLFANEMPSNDKIKLLAESSRKYNEMISEYRCAIKEIETKFNVLNEEFSNNSDQNPIDSIKSRVKTFESLIEKCLKRNIKLDIDNIKEKITDIAGVRVICNFPEDVYLLRNGLLQQEDIFLIKEKDYIKNPKNNGYRSLHLIVKTPIYLSTGKKLVTVEIQIRTIAMNFWASLEHQLRYKKDINNKEEISKELKELAIQSANLDLKMEELKKKIFN